MVRVISPPLHEDIRAWETPRAALRRRSLSREAELELRLERIVAYAKHCRDYEREVDPNNIIHLANE